MGSKHGHTGKFEVIVGKPALMIIDMQNDFLNQAHLVNFPNLISNTRRLLEAARRSRVPIIYTKESHRPGRIDMGSENYPGTGVMYGKQTPDGSCGIHCVEGTRGIEIVEELTPNEGDYVITKRRYNAFLSTDLDLLLKNLGVETLLVSGVFSDVCVLYTAGEAHQLDYYVRLVEDCTAGVTVDSTKAAVGIVRGLTTGTPIFLEKVLKALDQMANRSRRTKNLRSHPPVLGRSEPPKNLRSHRRRIH